MVLVDDNFSLLYILPKFDNFACWQLSPRSIQHKAHLWLGTQKLYAFSDFFAFRAYLSSSKGIREECYCYVSPALCFPTFLITRDLSWCRCPMFSLLYSIHSPDRFDEIFFSLFVGISLWLTWASNSSDISKSRLSKFQPSLLAHCGCLWILKNNALSGAHNKAK